MHGDQPSPNSTPSTGAVARPARGRSDGDPAGEAEALEGAREKQAEQDQHHAEDLAEAL
jgi:hypothetical protein